MNKIKELVKKIKIIYVPWHTFRLKLNEYKENKKQKAYAKYGNEVLFRISDMVANNHFRIAVTEGTLLGVIRDQKLIPWDDDLDFLILDEEGVDWTKLETELLKAGFWKYREKRGNRELLSKTYKYKGVHCDFVKWDSGNDFININYGCYEYKNKVYKNDVEAEYQVWEIKVPAIKEIEFREIKNKKVPVPQNSEEILKAIYGDWKTPNSKYKPARVECRKKFKFTYYTRNGKIKRTM